MLKERPDRLNAQLVRQVYDLRREAVMHESRNALGRFWPKTYGDLLKTLETE